MSLHTVCHSFEFDGEWWDMCVDFEVTSYWPPYDGDFYEPPHGASYEFKIVHIDHDLPKGSTPEPVADGLRKVVEEWFESSEGHEKASEQADNDRAYRDEY